MTVTVSPSRTFIPLPDSIVGAETDDSGIMLRDERGNPIVPRQIDALMNELVALAQFLRCLDEKVDKMSGTQDQVATDIQGLVASEAAMQQQLTAQGQLIAEQATATDQIKALVESLQVNQPLSQDMKDALHAAVTQSAANLATAQSQGTSAQAVLTEEQAILTGTATATATASST